MVSLISEEWSRPGGRAFGVVVSELGNREPTGPVILLEITVNAEVLFQGLVYSFCLSVCLGMIAGSEGGFRGVCQENGKSGRRTRYLGQR